jgi:metacaspase-1
MPRGISIHIGLNVIDNKHYGSSGELPNCDKDAAAMKKLALTEGYNVHPLLLNKKATSTNVLTALSVAADSLQPGDILLLTYSGHGSFFPDLNDDEDDKYDETWVLYDRMLIDDELYYAWSKFRAGVRILLISDSCHSGTVAKPLLLNCNYRQLDVPHQSSLKEILKAESQLLYKSHRIKYDQQLKFVPSPSKLNISASVILLSGCADNQFSYSQSRSGRKLSLFTDELLTEYYKKDASYTYATFLEAVRRRIPARLRQVPNFYTVGALNKKFIQQTPFQIG